MGRPTVARGVRGTAALLLETYWVQRSELHSFYAITYNYCIIRSYNDFYLPATLRLRVTVCIRKFSQVQNRLYLDKGSSYEAEAKTKI